MRGIAAMPIVLTLALPVVLPLTAAAADPDYWQASRITNGAIDESSSLAISTKYPGIAYTANDGSEGIIYAVEIATGRVVGRNLIDNFKVGDVEAMAVDRQNRIWVADLGAQRSSSSVRALYMFPEPPLGTHRIDANRYTVYYPGRPNYDVETFLLNPVTGHKFLVTKVNSGSAKLLALPAVLTKDHANVTSEVHVSDDLPQHISDGSFTPNGRWAVIRNNKKAFVLDPASEWAVDSTTVHLPDSSVLPNPESLSFDPDGMKFLVGTEGTPSPLWWVSFDQETGTVPSGGGL